MKKATKSTGGRKPAAKSSRTAKSSGRTTTNSKSSANARSSKSSAGGSARPASAASKSKPTARQSSSVPQKAVSRVTTDHQEIRRWAEERGGHPACVRGTGGKGDIGMIRIDFPGFSGERSLEPIEWDEWFEKFDDNNLALLFQEATSRGQKSNFNKIISRDTAEQATKPKVKRAGGR